MAEYSIAEVESLAGISARALRSYIRAGILAKPTPRGPLTTYDEAFVLRLLAARALVRQRLTLVEVKRHLHGVTPTRLAELAGVAPPQSPKAEAIAAAPAGVVAAEGTAAVATDLWRRLVLLPGVELHYMPSAPPLAQRVVREIEERYCATGDAQSAREG